MPSRYIGLFQLLIIPARNFSMILNASTVSLDGKLFPSLSVIFSHWSAASLSPSLTACANFGSVAPIRRVAVQTVCAGSGPNPQRSDDTRRSRGDVGRGQGAVSEELGRLEGVDEAGRGSVSPFTKVLARVTLSVRRRVSLPTCRDSITARTA